MSVPILPPEGPAPIVAPISRSDPPWRDDERFRVRLEQDGVGVPIEGHRVAVARRELTLVFELRGIDFISVNASYDARTLDLARANTPLGALDSVFGMGHGAAEEADPPHGIFVDDESFNTWGWSGDIHRCHVHEAPPGAPFQVCKRVVATFRHGAEETPVEASKAGALYLVVLSAEPDPSTPSLRELQCDWLTIAFR